MSSSVSYPLVYVRALAEHRWSEFCRAVRTPIEARIKALAWSYLLDDPRAPLPTKGTTPPEPTGRGSDYDLRWRTLDEMLARHPAQRAAICEIGEIARGQVWRGLVEGAMIDAARVDAETIKLFRATQGRPSAAERVFAYLEQHANLLEFGSPYGDQSRPDTPRRPLPGGRGRRYSLGASGQAEAGDTGPGRRRESIASVSYVSTFSRVRSARPARARASAARGG